MYKSELRWMAGLSIPGSGADLRQKKLDLDQTFEKTRIRIRPTKKSKTRSSDPDSDPTRFCKPYPDLTKTPN